ncbi:MAG: FAD-dependent oxidoreductase [bacterium]
MLGTLKSMKVTFSHLFKKKVTVQYPEQEKPFSDRYRGLHHYDVDRCIACKLCQTHCPDTDKVIKIDVETDPVTGKRTPTRFDIDFNMCCFCGICTEVCPTNCLQLTKVGNIASYDKKDFVYDMEALGTKTAAKMHPTVLHTFQQTKESCRDTRNQAEPPVTALSVKETFVEEAKDFHWLRVNIPCQSACPALTDVPGYIGAIAVGDYSKAYEINRHYNIFSGVLGRVCSRPCQDACRHLYPGNGDHVNICFLKRVADDFQGEDVKPPEKLFPASGKKVAVVGSGPAGMTAANDLSLMGHEVTVYESYSEPGGMLLQGIPKFRLPREVVAREIKQITALGVKIVCNAAVGKDIPMTTLLEEFDAVILAAGTLKPNLLDVPGNDLQGVLHGLEFMEEINRTDAAVIGKRVIVLGGGFTAMDCARGAVRVGAEQVGIFYRRTQKEMPVAKIEIEEATHEGVEIHELFAPLEFVGENGKVTGVKFIRNKLGEPDASGRRRPVAIEGSEVIIPADTVLLALGQSPDYAFLEQALGQGIFEKNWLQIDKNTHMTGVQKLFATGDFVSGASTIIKAVGMARRTANKVDTFLMGRQRRKSVVKVETVKETGRTRTDDFIPIRSMPSVGEKERKTLIAEVELGFPKDQAHEQAKRCYLCHHKFEIDMTKCILCEQCIMATPDHLDCIKRVAEFEKNEQGIVTGIKEANHGEEVKAIWINGKDCIRCGGCKSACPVDAISLQKVSLDEVTCKEGETGRFLEL